MANLTAFSFPVSQPLVSDLRQSWKIQESYEEFPLLRCNTSQFPWVPPALSTSLMPLLRASLCIQIVEGEPTCAPGAGWGESEQESNLLSGGE